MSSGEAALAQKAQSVEPGSFRQNVLFVARRFKSSWAELGKALVRVRDEGLFEGWGYPSFEAYCTRELHIRKSTADKLVRSFSFLARHEPQEAANEDVAERAPAFEVVEVLANAEERGQLSSDEYKSIRDSIWNPEKPTAELKREVAERFPPPPPEPLPDDMQVKRLAAFARKLAKELAGCRAASQALIDRAQALAEDVEGLTAGSKDN